MSKFNKFLAEDTFVSKNTKEVKQEKSSKLTSLKIRVDTLDTLRKVKMITKEQSYSVLIEKMIESYIKELSEEEKQQLNIILKG